MVEPDKKIKINLSQTREFLHDEYLEYFLRVEEQFFITNKYEIYKYIINNEQEQFLQFMLDKYPFDQPQSILKILRHYNGRTNVKSIINIILGKTNSLTNDFLRNDYWIDLLKGCTFEFVLEVNKIRKEKLIFDVPIDIYKHNINHFYDKKVYFWLLDLYEQMNLNNKNIFSCLYKIFNSDKNKKIATVLDNIQYLDTPDELEILLEKLNLNPSVLDDVFILGNQKHNGYMTYNIIYFIAFNNKYKLFYKLFELVNPKILIKSKQIAMDLVRNFIINSEIKYEIFMFISLHIVNLGYTNIFKQENFDSRYFTNKIDESKIFELIKLNIIPPKNSKYYKYYKFIRKIDNVI